ncbi:hypothetical protein TROPICALSUN_71 [Erwinia phage vB_EamM_TropicalSun]|uniref:Uncharacterized protein n=2 Tax=Myosmarvirus myosmar TaxID=2846183 RepID=A0A5B9NQL7_9CAUD|nr:hypothetical protein HWC56_gp024 [Serratia phage MyoSmar]QEG09473.1 hypothetical protein CPT_MyoSmar_024 [Serratia phage MyoSmar]QEG13861.1 hypothetical protein TROPICALSUN_71 [Erwinia phage vB_EamM_TropicalSun]
MGCNVENLNKGKPILVLLAGRPVGPIVADELEYPIDFYTDEEPMTAKQSMLRGRPDLLKESWRRKGKR